MLRLGVGDRILCCDGAGAEYVGTIARAHRRGLTVAVERRLDPSTPPPGGVAQGRGLMVWLAQGLPKAGRFEWIVQKATELGVARVSPLLTRHSVIRLGAEQGRAKHARWKRIAQEAAEQCRRSTVPIIDPPQPFEPFIRMLARAELVLIPTLAVTAIPLSEALKEARGVRDVLVLIGPEGDFSREEVALAQHHGARPVSLGALTLRTETAAVAMLAILDYAFGRM
ncbi:MAG: 16S rRNA (uracil(1498)-N(3))-methyltransferase [Candidatus Omnitrophica bacterium]|nr:16S rRNA (uracil(1498)-N(3))-methyltransferase [Candidatus Omnitrophota bacterium]